MIDNVLMFGWTFSLLFLFSTLVMASKTESIYLEVTGLNVRSASNLDNIIGQVGAGDIVKLQIPSSHLIRENGVLDLEASFSKWAQSVGFESRGSHTYFPTQVLELKQSGETYSWADKTFEGSGEPMAAMIFAARRNMLTERPERELNSIIEGQLRAELLRMRPRDYMRWTDYSRASLAQEESCDLSNVGSKFRFPDIISNMVELRTHCLENLAENGFSQLYPNSEMRSGKSYSQCVGWVRDLTCQNEILKGLSVEEKAKQMIRLSLPYVQEMNLNPAVPVCIGAAETTTLKSAARTEVACSDPPNYSAAGVFQVTKATIGDIVSRGMIDLRSSGDGETPTMLDQPKSREFIEKILGPELAKKLKEPGISLTRRGNNCSESKDCLEIQDALYDRMASSLDLQVILSSLVFTKDKKYSLENYHGNKNSEVNRKYALPISRCIDCFHSRYSVGDGDIMNCIGHAAKATPEAMERENKLFEERCKDQEMKCKE